MDVWEVFLIGAALALDAVAVGMTDGMTEPRMRPAKSFAVAATFGLFQFAMPVLGYYCGYAFSSLVREIAPYLSFALLALLGGKMLVCGVKELRGEQKRRVSAKKTLTAGKLFLQAVATSLDALAVGVTFLALDSASALPFHAALCALVVGVVTFLMSLAAVETGRRMGSVLSEGTEALGGGVLMLIGLKILLEGVL